MLIQRTFRLDAAVPQVWELVSDIPALSGCIPGLEKIEVQDARHFRSLVRQRVGPISMTLDLDTHLEDLEPPRRVTALTEGRDRALGARVRQRQVFELCPAGDQTEVKLSVDVQFSGRLAAFGHRVIGAKAEQFTEEVIRNVSALLAWRGRDTAAMTPDAVGSRPIERSP
jgi:carbon monoxide dehydrogenase subunit G